MRGALVAIDARGCQKEIAGKIGELSVYVLTVKENQATLLANVKACCAKAA